MKALHCQGKLVEAKNLYRKALSIDPNCFEEFQLLGALLVQTQHHSDAIEVYPRHYSLTQILQLVEPILELP